MADTVANDINNKTALKGKILKKLTELLNAGIIKEERMQEIVRGVEEYIGALPETITPLDAIKAVERFQELESIKISYNIAHQEGLSDDIIKTALEYKDKKDYQSAIKVIESFLEESASSINSPATPTAVVNSLPPASPAAPAPISPPLPQPGATAPTTPQA